MLLTDFQHKKLYPFQNLSLGFMLKIFFANFSLDILIKKKNECTQKALNSPYMSTRAEGIFFQASVEVQNCRVKSSNNS